MWLTWKINKYLTFKPGLSQKMWDFRKKQDDRSCPLQTWASRSKLESWNIWLLALFWGNPVLFQKKVHLKVFFFAKLTGKHLYQNLVFHKVAVWKLQLHLKETPAQAFSCVYFKNSFFTEDIRVTASSLHRILLFRTLDYLISSL